MDPGVILQIYDEYIEQQNLSESGELRLQANKVYYIKLSYDPSITYNQKMYTVSIIPNDYVSAKEIASGSYHTLLLQDNGQVLAWGRNENGQCGVPTSDIEPLTMIPSLDNVLGLAAGQYHSVAVKDVYKRQNSPSMC